MIYIMQDKDRFTNDQLLSFATGGLFCPDWLGGKRVQGRARTCWRDYSSQQAWERLVIAKQEVEDVVGEEKHNWAGKLTDGRLDRKLK